MEYGKSSSDSTVADKKSRKKKSKEDKTKIKKHKKKSRHYTSPSSESNDEYEWVEKVSEKQASPTITPNVSHNVQTESLERDEWMNVESFIPCVSKSDIKKQKSETQEDAKKRLSYEPGQSNKELNPHWKNGGSGLPQAEKANNPQMDVSWLKKSLQRAEEQALREDRSLEDVAAERWGSLEIIRSMIAKAEKASDARQDRSYHRKHHKDRNRQDLYRSYDQTGRHSQSRWNSREHTKPYSKSDYLSQDTRDKRSYQKPKDHDDDSQQSRHRSIRNHVKNWKKDKGHSDNQRIEIPTSELKESSSSNIDNVSGIDESVVALTEAEMNKLGAKIVKAEIMGDHELANQLKARLEKARKLSPVRDVTTTTQENRKIIKSTDECWWCPDSKNMLEHMVITIDSTICLSLPAYAALTSKHCILTPINHVPCQLLLETDEWEKLKELKQKLIEMFMSQDLYPIFFEMYRKRRKFSHMQLECIPLPKEIGELGPIYFKKALLECENEMGVNKQVIDLKHKTIRRAVPKDLSYFMVEFATHPGYAHVIEHELLFPKNFAEEIIGGMLELDTICWRKPRKQNFDEQRIRMLEFRNVWQKVNSP